MSRTLRILERARTDVDNIFDWLVHRSVRGAITWYLAFGRAVEKIAAAPESYAAAPEADLLGRPLRQSLFKTRRGRIYRIVFEFTDTETVLLRVRGPGQPRLKRRELPSE
jgi:plasmid stabilization system protein ParE